MSAPRSLAFTMSVAFVALIVYASLHPFAGWELPTTWMSPEFWIPPWPHYWTWFDLVSNVLGYLPLGLFIALSALARGRRGPASVGIALAIAAVLAWALETLQHLVPVRVPSMLDALLNVVGAGLGALLAWLFQALGWVSRWHGLRDRWMVSDDGSALTLMLLWPVGLLVPTAAPMALGHVAGPMLDTLMQWTDGTGLQAWTERMIEALAIPLPQGVESLTTVCGLLAPSLVAYTVVRHPWHRIVLVLGAAAMGVIATSLSTVLNFGPQHALSWLNQDTPAAFGASAMVALALLILSPRQAAVAGMVVGLLSLVLVNLTPVDPYLSSSLQQWEQARFIRFHGVSQWIGWAWPPVALLYHLRALVRTAPR